MKLYFNILFCTWSSFYVRKHDYINYCMTLMYQSHKFENVNIFVLHTPAKVGLLLIPFCR